MNDRGLEVFSSGAKPDLAIICLAGGQICNWAGLYYLFPAMLVKWETVSGWSRVDLTGALTLAIFISAIASPFAGKVIDQGKGHLLMTLSAIIGGVCLYGLSCVTSLAQFYLIWGLIGVAHSGCLYEPCFALITRCRNENAKNGIVLVTVIAGFASAVCFPLAHYLSSAFGWEITARVFSGLVILLGAPLTWLGSNSLGYPARPQLPETHHRREKPELFIRLPAFWLLALGFAFSAVVHGITLHHLLPMLNERQIAADVAATIASLIGPMQVVGRLAMMTAFRYVTHHSISISCFVIMGCSSLALMVAGTETGLLVGFVVLFGGGYGMVNVIRPVIARDILGQNNFGAKSGALALFFLTGAASAPFLGSLIWQAGGYELVLPTLIALSAVGLALYLLAAGMSQKLLQ